MYKILQINIKIHVIVVRCLHINHSLIINYFADWPGNEVDLILARKSTEPVRHEITLLLDKTVVAILSLTKTTTAVSVCFDVNGLVKKTAIVPSGGIITVKRCHGFFFTLFSGGCVCILFSVIFVKGSFMYKYMYCNVIVSVHKQ